MKKHIVLVLVSFGLLASVKNAHAALININKEGEIIWNVLSLQDELLANEEIEDFTVRQVAQINNSGNDLINIKQQDGKVTLAVGSGDSTREIEVEEIENELIEIEERAATQKLSIGKKGEHFVIQQSGTIVNTNLPIQINPMTARLSLATSTGDNYLYILPKDAIRSVLRAKVISAVRVGESLELSELDNKLVYKIPGEKIIPVFDFYKYSFDVDSYVSAQTGELVSVDAPTWYKIFGFLITQQT